MLMIIYTEQQLIYVHRIKNNTNVLLSSAHGTGKSMIFVNHATYQNDMYYAVGREDYNLTKLVRSYQHEHPTITKQQRLFLDNVLVNDVNLFKLNYDILASRLQNLHVIVYFKHTHNLERYFPNSTDLTTYFGPASQLQISTKIKGDYMCLSDEITGYINDSKPVILEDEKYYIPQPGDKIVNNNHPYNYALEGRFPKQSFHGPYPLLCYTPVLLIRVNDFNDPIDERLLKATSQLKLLKVTPPTEEVNPNTPAKNTVKKVTFADQPYITNTPW